MGHTLPFSFAQDTHLTMNAFILLACVAASSAQYIAHPRVHGVAGAYPYAAGAYAGAYPAAYAAGAPVVAAGAYPYAAAAPVVAAPIPSPSSQFQAQDEFGNLQYGYANINSQKHEVGNTYGGVQGSYSYVDANGVVQTTNYVADHLGFRVQATNLPVAPAVPEVELPVAPVFEGKAPVFNPEPLVAPTFNPEPLVAPVFDPAPLEDTPEVKAAKEAFQAAFEAEANREKRSAETPAATEPLVVPAAPAVVAHPYAAAAYPYAGVPFAHAGLHHNYGYATAAGLVHPAAAVAPYAAAPYAATPYAGLVHPGAAVVASAPAVRDAELHTVKLNPGHAVAYRVY